MWKPPSHRPPPPASVTSIPVKGLGNQSDCPRLPSPHPSPNTGPPAKDLRGPHPTHSTVTGSACRGALDSPMGTDDDTVHSSSVTPFILLQLVRSQP